MKQLILGPALKEIVFFEMVHPRHFLANKTVIIIIIRLSREMNNKKISCVAKNNEINAPKTRTVTVQMNCK